MRGLYGVTAWDRICGSNQAIMGFIGRAGALIDQLTFRCAPIEITWDGAIFSASRGTFTDLPAQGTAGGTAFAQTDCGADQLATVANIRAGDSLDALGLGCQIPTLSY